MVIRERWEEEEEEKMVDFVCVCVWVRKEALHI